MAASARKLAEPMELSAAQLEELELLGICNNYNGYGAALADLHFAPAELYALVSAHESPFAFMEVRKFSAYPVRSAL